MRAVVQRVSRAEVRVAGEVTGRCGHGLLVLVGVAAGDDAQDRTWMARKIAGLRIFEDEDGRMQHAVGDVGGSLLLVSQFTLLGDVRRGRRPNFGAAMAPDLAEPAFDALVDDLRAEGLPVETGRFGAMMEVDLVNDGPVTLVLDSRERT